VESLLLNKRWNPCAILVVLNKLIFDISDFNEPRVKSSVDQRGLRSPAERIAMDDCTSTHESALGLKAVLNELIRLFNICSFIVGHSISKLAIKVNRNGSFSLFNKAALNTDLVIILTEPRSTVDNTSTGL